MSDVSFDIFSSEFKKDLDIKDNLYLKSSLQEVLQFDSIGKIVISLTIERLFGFQIPYKVLEETENIHALYQYCVNRVSQSN
jgi:acyl carrier protein